MGILLPLTAHALESFVLGVQSRKAPQCLAFLEQSGFTLTEKLRQPPCVVDEALPPNVDGHNKVSPRTLLAEYLAVVLERAGLDIIPRLPGFDDLIFRREEPGLLQVPPIGLLTFPVLPRRVNEGLKCPTTEGREGQHLHGCQANETKV